jgi:hypothetical protein
MRNPSLESKVLKQQSAHGIRMRDRDIGIANSFSQIIRP